MKRLTLAFLILSGFVSAALAGPPVNARLLLKHAQAEAKRQNKNVFVTFHASWCGWCHKLDAFMNDKQFKPVFDRNYVIVNIDVLEQPDKKMIENPYGAEVLADLGGKDSGLPFFAILNPEGKKLIDSKRPVEGKTEGMNIGHPAEPQEIEYFISMLKKTSGHLSSGEVNAMTAYLSKPKG